MIKKVGFTVTFGLLCIMTSCYNDKMEELYPVTQCDTASVSYSKHISPIINSSCATSGCHKGAAPAGGIDLSTHAQVKIIVDNGKLLGSINHSSGFVAMPQGANKLSNCNLAQFAQWISAGAADN